MCFTVVPALLLGFSFISPALLAVTMRHHQLPLVGMGNLNPNQGIECIYIAKYCRSRSNTIQIYTMT
jgi:hypothetical protein